MLMTLIVYGFGRCDLEEQLEYVDLCDGCVLTEQQTALLWTTAGLVREIVKQPKLAVVAERGKVSDKWSRSGAARTEFDFDRTGMTDDAADPVCCMTGPEERRDAF